MIICLNYLLDRCREVGGEQEARENTTQYVQATLQKNKPKVFH